MDAREKAIELIRKHLEYVNGWSTTSKPNELPRAQYDGEKMKLGRAKQLALISVEEIYFGLYNYLKDSDELQNADREFNYWNKVKEEINHIK